VTALALAAVAALAGLLDALAGPQRCTCGDPCGRCGGCGECCACIPGAAAVAAARAAHIGQLAPGDAAELIAACAELDAMPDSGEQP
jgi:hypothetical protein